ncbi:MAG: hypothetical protein ACTTJW_06765 [Sphaerochaeta sp.]
MKSKQELNVYKGVKNCSVNNIKSKENLAFIQGYTRAINELERAIAYEVEDMRELEDLPSFKSLKEEMIEQTGRHIQKFLQLNLHIIIASLLEEEKKNEEVE